MYEFGIVNTTALADDRWPERTAGCKYPSTHT
jgi:hypothetical protein